MGPTLLLSKESTAHGTLCWILKFSGSPPPGGFNVGILPASRCEESECLRMQMFNDEHINPRKFKIVRVFVKWVSGCFTWLHIFVSTLRY